MGHISVVLTLSIVGHISVVMTERCGPHQCCNDFEHCGPHQCCIDFEHCGPHQCCNGQHGHLECGRSWSEPRSDQTKDYEIVFAASPLSTQH